MPRTFGECSVHISEIDHIIEHDQPLVEAIPKAPTEVDRKIAQQIIERINDGDTLQIGVGGVPNAVLSGLKQHKDLGLHSELFSPAMVPLIQAGILNGRRKTWMQHKHIFTFALGDRALYEFLDDNPAIVGYPASWVNNPDIIRLNDNMVSVLERTAETYRPLLVPCIVADVAVRIRDVLVTGRRRDEDPR